MQIIIGQSGPGGIQSNLEQMQRVVRNNTRKSSLFKIQAQKSKFMDHFADFGCCSLLENHPECAEYEDYLKELTELFIKYSFDAAEDSPFFQGMNYNGRYCGFSNNSYSFSYREWLPNVSQAFLEGPCNKPNPRQYELTNDGNSFFELTVEEHFETFADGDTIRLILIDEQGSRHTCPPPSARRLHYDQATKQFLGVYNRTQKTKGQDTQAASSSMLAFEMDIHKESLATWLEFLPRIAKCKFNTVIIKNIFEYKDKTLKPPLINRYSVKLNHSEAETLKQIIDKLRDEQIKVLFDIDFFHQKYELRNALDSGYLVEDAPFQFNLKKKGVVPFLLASLSYLMTHFKIDGLKFSSVDKVLLRPDTLSRYQQPYSFSKTFMIDCTKESILFIKLINMIINRNNPNFISYCSSNCLIPGAYIPLDEGGFGFNFSSQECPKNPKSLSTKNITLTEDKPMQLYFNVVGYENRLATPQDQLDVLIEYLWSPNGAVCMQPSVITQGKQSTFQLLQSVMDFRNQGEYFMEPATTSKDFIHHSPRVICFNRNKYVFIINTDSGMQKVVVNNSQPADSIYCSRGNEIENIKSTFEDGKLTVEVPPETAVVLEKERIN